MIKTSLYKKVKKLFKLKGIKIKILKNHVIYVVRKRERERETERETEKEA